MYELQVEHRFCARHGVRLPSGQLEPLHEHQWRLRTTVTAENLDENGMVMDFHALRKLLKKTAMPLEQSQSVSDVAFFTGQSVSTEQIARFFYEMLARELPQGIRLAAVTLWEEPDCSATYFPDAK